jgi:DNA-directed RNA polymerase
MAIQLFDQGGLLFGQDVFKCLSKVSVFQSHLVLIERYLLNNTAAVPLQRQGQDMAFHLLCQVAFLHLVSVLEELMKPIVSENVGRQVQGVLSNFGKDDLLLVAVCRFELLLDEARAVLISAKFNNVLVDIPSIINTSTTLDELEFLIYRELLLSVSGKS